MGVAKYANPAFVIVGEADHYGCAVAAAVDRFRVLKNLSNDWMLGSTTLFCFSGERFKR